MTTNTYEAIVTAYCACMLCTPGRGITASGDVPRANHTIAAPRLIPFGASVVVSGNAYVVRDRTAKRFDGRFDIYFRTHKEARKFGIRKLTVTIITP